MNFKVRMNFAVLVFNTGVYNMVVGLWYGMNKWKYEKFYKIDLQQQDFANSWIFALRVVIKKLDIDWLKENVFDKMSILWLKYLI